MAILSQHRGRANPISAPEIARTLRIPEREVRRVLSAAHREGACAGQGIWPLAAPGVGFFLGQDYEEFLSYENSLAKQEHSIREKRRAFRQFAASQGIHFPPTSDPSDPSDPSDKPHPPL